MNTRLYTSSIAISIIFTILCSGIAFSSNLEWNEMKSTTSAQLQDIWGQSTNDLYAVGFSREFNSSETQQDTILHYNGKWWQEMSIDSKAGLSAIWGTSSSDIFAAGSSILHYDGKNWVDMETGLDDFYLTDLWGTASDSIYSVGFGYANDGYGGIIMSYDGQAWTLIDDIDTTTLSSIWGASSDNIFTVGDGVYHFDGQAWTRSDSPLTQADFYAVWGASASDVYAGGKGLIHFDGHDWTEISTGLEDVEIHDIWGASASDIYAVGKKNISSDITTLVLHYDGQAWSEITLDDTALDINGIWGLTPNDIYIVGYLRDYDSREDSSSILYSGPDSSGICVSSKLLDADDPRLHVLRDYRDNVLSKSTAGQRLITLYYNCSAAMSAMLDTQPMLKKISAKALKTVANVLDGMLL
ncbi:MAG: hypothetical protein GY868_02970 [Deltaproteobacteria bacterium]|nr:hypothetical protein [Deltaproteobacteria bacterium]